MSPIGIYTKCAIIIQFSSGGHTNTSLSAHYICDAHHRGHVWFNSTAYHLVFGSPASLFVTTVYSMVWASACVHQSVKTVFQVIGRRINSNLCQKVTSYHISRPFFFVIVVFFFNFSDFFSFTLEPMGVKRLKRHSSQFATDFNQTSCQMFWWWEMLAVKFLGGLPIISH